tara:strand:- start:24503 stop:25489 length:987 start_codon:yes stop_codon:yes gene_type:complete
MTKPLVSINCITYNHENYIAKTIEGFLIQKTTFPIEIVICEDASTDNTAKIIQEYVDKYPDLIIPLFQETNQYSKGKNPGFEIAMPKCRGKYIAHCEGDDYWTDPYKLQKQVDFMESNTEYSFIFHDCEIFDQKTGEKNLRVGNRQIDEVVNLESIILENNVPTASIMHRNILDFRLLPQWYLTISKGDYALVILLSERGLGKYLPDVMSVYRVHSGGVWSGTNIAYRNNEDIKFFNFLYEQFSDQEVREAIKRRLNHCLLEKAFVKIKRGELLSGFCLYLLNVNSNKEKKNQNGIKKILGAFKIGIRHLFRKPLSYVKLEADNSSVL